MQKKDNNGIKIKLLLPLVLILIVLLTVSIALFSKALRYDRSCDWENGKLYSVAIEGKYSEEGGEWKSLSEETEFDYRELRDITVKGHFTRDIPKGEPIFFNICQLWVTLQINGEEVFSFAKDKDSRNPTKALGNMWYTLESPGITVGDEIKLRFGNIYENAYFIQFDNLLWHMYTGSERGLVSAAIHKDAGSLGMGVIFLVLTLILILTGILLAILRLRGALQFLWLGLCTLFSALWFATLAPALSLLLPYPVFLNILYSYSIQGMVMAILLFVTASLSGWRKKMMFVMLGVLTAAMIIVVELQIAGISDMFQNINYTSMLDMALALFLSCALVYEIHILKNRTLFIFLKPMIPLVLFGVLEMINGYTQWMVAGIFLGIGLFLFAISEMFLILRRIHKSLESEKRALELEKELSQNRISMMLSQIQPHFLYNALTGIKELCSSNPEGAQDALEHFSYFLRGNLDALSYARLIPFDKELSHVKDYFYLEKMRFGGRVNLILELEFTDFLLPSMTIQPLVENAVRYGITQKDSGGMVLVRSEYLDKQVHITIRDDGAGFEVNVPKEDGRSHTGIQNVRNRLELQCGGTLRIESKLGVGTVVRITLPGKEAGYV